MKTIKINLNTIDKVKEFVNIIGKFSCEADLVTENSRYVIDAKSIMGIFSLDISKNLNLMIHEDSPETLTQIEMAIERFIVA